MGPDADFIWPERKLAMAKEKKIFHLDGQRDPQRRKNLEDSSIDVEVVMPNGDVSTMKAYRKTSLTYATAIPVDFEVDTLEGLHTAHAGDYLAVGPHGEMYPVAKDIFEHMYEEVKDGE